MNSSEGEQRQLRQEWLLVFAATSVLSLLAFSYCLQHNLLLLYGDAVAHLHIARRVFDSMNPGFRQLGSVWLPLPHILLIPFVQRMDWWQSGVAGAIPSMACYVAGCVGLYRLARIWLSPLASTLRAGVLRAESRAALHAVDGDDGAAVSGGDDLVCVADCAILPALAGKTVERRGAGADCGWPCACGSGVYALRRMDLCQFCVARWSRLSLWRHRALRDPVVGMFLLFTVMLAMAPAMWCAYNAKQFGDPLDFLRGPYSAKAIELRTATPGAPHYPGWHSMRVAALHFLKAAELGVIPERFGKWLVWLCVVGDAVAIYQNRSKAILAALLLWIPLPFYAYSIAYGSVPIFVPVWWPFSFYNTRYGMEMLPAFALFLAFAVGWAGDWLKAGFPRWTKPFFAVAMLLVVWNTVVLLRAGRLFCRRRLRIPALVFLSRERWRMR